MLDWKLFISVYTLIFIAELPDKTALATLMMATQGSPVPIFIGVALAFVVQTLFAVLFGNFIALLPERWVHLGVGFLFLAFSASLLWNLKKDEKETESAPPLDPAHFYKTMLKAFVLIFIAEWGDLTQLATASLVARSPEQTWTIALAATLALWSVTGIAVFIGHKIKHRINVEKLKLLSAIIFIGIGFYFIATFFGWLSSSHV